jgi:hypothetical protein
MAMSDLAKSIILVCDHVFRNVRAVSLVIRHADGGWQMTCGKHDHPEDGPNAATVHMHHLIERQPELEQFLDLEPGYLADRVGSGWEILMHDS